MITIKIIQQIPEYPRAKVGTALVYVENDYGKHYLNLDACLIIPATFVDTNSKYFARTK